MTIRQHLDRCARPYLRNMRVCFIVFGTSGACMALMSTHVPPFDDRDSIWFSWQWLVLLGLLYLGSGVGAIASGVICCIRVRCPGCGKSLGWVPKKWKYCHFCGLDFDTEMQDPPVKLESKPPPADK